GPGGRTWHPRRADRARPEAGPSGRPAPGDPGARRRRSALPGSGRLFLDSRDHYAPHEDALEDQEQDHGHDQGHQSAGRDETRFLRGAIGAERRQTDGQGLEIVFGRQVDERREDVVPRVAQVVYGDRDDLLSWLRT